MSESRNYKRSNYFIEKKFQAQFILKFCALVAAGALLTIGILYFLSSKSTTVSIVDSRVEARATAVFLLPILIQTLLIVMLFVGLATVVITLFVSHKISGPLYHFKKTMKELEQGDFSSDFRIRCLDQMQGLAEIFNAMIGKTRKQVNLIKANFSALKEKLNNLSEEEVAEHKKAVLTELKNIARELDKIIDYFKS
jgi:methyl-accepting chemotaxis protein